MMTKTPLLILTLFSLFYLNAYADILEDSTSNPSKKSKSAPIIYPEHKVSIDVFSYIGGEVLVQYDYLFPKQKVAVRIPLGYIFFDEGRNLIGTFGTKDDYNPLYSEHFYKIKAIHTGAEWMLFLNPPKKIRWYIAPGIRSYLFWANREVTIREEVDERYIIIEQFQEKKTSFNLGGNLNIGMQGITKRNLSFGAEAGFGLGKPLGYNFNHRMMINYRISFHVGYHFGKRQKSSSE